MGIEADEIPKELTPLKKLFMNKGQIEAYNARREDLLVAFETEQKNYLARQEEFFCKQILANSEDFSPQWDIGYLKSLTNTHNQVIEQEKDFKKEFLNWVEKNIDTPWMQKVIMPLLLVL